MVSLSFSSPLQDVDRPLEMIEAAHPTLAGGILLLDKARYGSVRGWVELIWMRFVCDFEQKSFFGDQEPEQILGVFFFR